MNEKTFAGVKIEQGEHGKPFRHRVYVGGKEIENISRLELTINPFEAPTLTLDIGSGIAFDGKAIVEINKSSNSAMEAVKIVRDELHHHGELYAGFWASIRSAIEEALDDISADELALRILDRIIGED